MVMACLRVVRVGATCTGLCAHAYPAHFLALSAGVRTRVCLRVWCVHPLGRTDAVKAARGAVQVSFPPLSMSISASSVVVTVLALHMYTEQIIARDLAVFGGVLWSVWVCESCAS